MEVKKSNIPNQISKIHSMYVALMNKDDRIIVKNFFFLNKK